MARIPDTFLNCVVYLYLDKARAEAGEERGGSGFLIGLRVEGYDQIGVTLVVTNKHVVDSGAGVVRINTVDGQIEALEIDDRDWLCSPTDDLAVAPINISPEQHLVSVITPDNFITEQNLSFVGIGDECFMVGRFVNHQGKLKNKPTLRFGNIAQMNGEKIKFGDGSEQDGFLVEARSIPGYSGAPVFVRSSRAAGAWLLGVGHCHLLDYRKIIDISTKCKCEVNKHWRVQENTGMMGVVPAWKLKEMFDHQKISSLLEDAKQKARQV